MSVLVHPRRGLAMPKKVDWGVVLFLMWLVLHRLVLKWYRHYLGLP